MVFQTEGLHNQESKEIHQEEAEQGRLWMEGHQAGISL